MSAGVWPNNDGMTLFYGTLKSQAATAGDYQMPGPNRQIEVLIDLSTLNITNATVIDQGTFFPSMANFYIEKVELVAEVAMSTSSSPTLSIGLCGTNLNYSGGTTVNILSSTYSGTALVPTNGATAFVNALAASNLSAAGDLVTLTHGSSGAGSYIGDYEDSTNLTAPAYLTATLGTTTATGKIRVRIFYHGVGTIPN